ncbi:hypothetical protein J2741_000568 [Methanolinea mesophila]|uniref:hypothetical protein n=1 Tax=Methanolinea mesophila TaxID=547055 RepID=UPI001AE36631|nr:hypothetical protein [Methanolinea mesophila]MBP1928021.1 hypothetical protein [Methanolinea mesophila]
MSAPIPPTDSLATGVGALPHLDPGVACETVLSIYPEIPYIPTLPKRGIRESIVFADSARLPGGAIREGRLTIDTARDIPAEMERIYLDFVEGNLDPYIPTKEFASAFIEMLGRDVSGCRILKCQVTGPVTFGMQVVDRDRRPLYYDEQYADVISKMIALRAAACESAMAGIRGVSRTLVVVNEPYFAALGSSVVPVDREMVRSGWHDIASSVRDGLGIHCCANTDWEFVLSLRPSLLSFDAYTMAGEFMLYGGAVAEYLEAGGVIGWGIVPAEYAVFTGVDREDLYTTYMDIRKRMCELVDPSLFDAGSLITPTCGIQFGTPEGAGEIMKTSAWLSRKVRGETGS